MYQNLKSTVCQHTGEFLCREIHNEENTKIVPFSHIVTEATDLDGVPDIGDLKAFYATFGSILFYYDHQSGEAGKYLAPPSAWSRLNEDFSLWFEDLELEETEDFLPDWIETTVVIGETPRSGNYILVPAEGSEAGHIFEFDHDGFEFIHMANNLIEYVARLLKPDALCLTDIASHMRFIEKDSRIQWWIRELKDNCGHVVRTRA